ncbi:EARP-interacting protein homolog [Ciona intestinalis]
MDVEDAPLIYGLELPARCMCSQSAECNVTRFIVGTQSLKQENQIHLVEFDDENNQLEKTVFAHSSGEIWHLSSSFNNPLLFSTCYSNYKDGELVTGCKIHRMVSDSKQETSENDEFDSGAENFESIDEVCTVASSEINHISSLQWKPVEDDHQVIILGDGKLHLFDLEEEKPNSLFSFMLPEKKGHPLVATCGKWNPHHGAKQFAVAAGQNITSFDMRSKSPAFQLNNCHGQMIRDLDFNPNKQYHLATCGDDCLVKFWDTREPSAPISVLEDDHSHWVWGVRFNPFHDQLVLSCGSDSRVVLHNKASISSEPFGHLVEDEEDEETEKRKDGLIAVYEEHEDSVYAVEWSAADPWSFASLSYDGRIVINKVPKNVKFEILL